MSIEFFEALTDGYSPLTHNYTKIKNPPGTLWIISGLMGLPFFYNFENLFIISGVISVALIIFSATYDAYCRLT